ncbi:B-cell receptor CD22-like isoform X2 [Xyrauchen texanus]|uniref:B-cell receptor CD22-like isoform X1 n=1 Tax=Xyrauchen texanus TaxID=154827 RepID=UPI00224277B3|nr:B-cell receptor CD22-like isoform X1 [Xyrauchen texanus]XP_051981530.1 B-cell receptor CD22-like isoform X1 [Xyrauchen texanus]XP_051981539.1 B-cell receptor CD22-like isoform X2 [Xyrauchen texanus]
MESSVESSVLPLIILLMSNSYFAQTPDKPVLTANPETSLIFRGDTVTLTCDVQETRVTDWTYRFQCDGGNIQDTNWKEFKTTVIYSRYSGYNKCKCLAMSTSTQISTSMSNEVSFTVIDKPKPVLTVNPETSPIYRGDTVTLTCDLQGTRVTDWKYRFQCDGVYQESNEKEFKITAMNSRYRKCKCYARRTYRRIDTDWSNEVSFTVIERPKPEVRVNPDHHVFRGETVTLTCDIQTQTHTEWRYSWIKDDSVNPVSTERVYRITSDKSHSGKYSCRGEKISDSQRSDISDAVTLTVSDKPTPAVIVSPQSSVFTGDTVTLSCTFTHSTGWTIHWNKDSNSESSDAAGTKTIRSVKVSDGGQYRCRAQRGKYYTKFSNTVQLTVKARPKPEVRVNPDHHVFRGETVTLTCDIQTQTHTEWRYSWIKDDSVNPVSTERVYRITSDKSHSGKYSCRGEKISDSQRSDISDAVTLTVSVVSPSVSLIISPSRSQHFSSHSLSLNCEDHNNSTGWTVRRNTDSERMKDCSSTGSTCEISSLKTSDTGVYWCESQSGEHSPHINITVHDGDVILESSVHPVIEGDTLTLHCLHRSTNSSILTADFYKDGSLLQNQTTGEMSIPTVSKSHEGFYSCKHGERGQSPESWISVTVSDGDLGGCWSECRRVTPHLTDPAVEIQKREKQ